MAIHERINSFFKEREWFYDYVNEIANHLEKYIIDSVYENKDAKRFNVSYIAADDGFLIHYEIDCDNKDNNYLFSIHLPVFFIDVKTGVIDYFKDFVDKNFKSFSIEAIDYFNDCIKKSEKEIIKLDKKNKRAFFGITKNINEKEMEIEREIIRLMKDNINLIYEVEKCFSEGMIKRFYYETKKYLDERLGDDFKYTENVFLKIFDKNKSKGD